ncbi:MAG: hypothetical protein AAF602_24500 [Myxococcota bacterium]
MRGLVASIVLLLPASSFAGPLSPWGVHTTSGETWLTPYLFVDSGAVSNNTYLSIGLGERFDIIGGVGVGFAGQFEAGVVEAMPRFFVDDSLGLVLRVGSVPGMPQLELGPEVHGAWTAGRFAFTANVGWRPMVGDGADVGSAFAVLAPELFLTDNVSLFVEANPGVALTTGETNLTIVPGFSFAVGDQGFAFGTMLPAADPGAWTLGAWWSARLGTVGGS